MQLKEFQTTALKTLAEFLAEARKAKEDGKPVGPREAFERRGLGAYRTPVHDKPKAMKGKPVLSNDPPFICLRVPTGGGKTLMAAHAVGRAFQHGLARNLGLVLWLVPSKEIAEQTLKALRWPRHGYRLGLQDGLGSEDVLVVDIPEALALPYAAVRSQTVVIVGTIQSFKKQANEQRNVEGRKVYEDNGQLYSHREDLRAYHHANPGVLDPFPGAPDEPLCSLVNVVARHNPVVIVDEAHNAGTDLHFETLERLKPGCVIEFTATPDREKFPSNVLVQVSASELKGEGLIKLPVELEKASDPLTALVKGKAIRERLQLIAEAVRHQEGRYVRPIMLIQAQPDATQDAWTAEKVKKALIEDCNIPENHIAIATGTTRDLKGRNLFSPEEHIRYIITQRALVEGWDCSFAYVLCALTESHSATAVEQLLGRILRMPNATPFKNGELNKAYGVICTSSFQQTVMELREKFVEHHGFTPVEANRALQPVGEEGDAWVPEGDGVDTDLAGMVELPPLDQGQLPTLVLEQVRVDAHGKQWVDRRTLRRHRDEFAKAANDTTAIKKLVHAELFAGERGERIEVPWLLFHGDPFEEMHFAAWPLPLEEVPLLGEFDPRELREVARLDVKGTTLAPEFEDFAREVALPAGMETSEQFDHLAQRIDSMLHRGGRNSDVLQSQGTDWCRRQLEALAAAGIPKAELDRGRFRLTDKIQTHWAEWRQKFRDRGFDAALMDTSAFSYDPAQAYVFGPEEDYLPPTTEPHSFKRHHYRVMAVLDSPEERDVAGLIDRLPGVESWVRNLSFSRKTGFYLMGAQTAFFPDFVVKLKNGKLLLVEVKGTAFAAKAQDKKSVGERWAAATGNHFEWVLDTDIPGLESTWFGKYGAV